MGKTTDTYEIYIRNPVIVPYIKLIQTSCLKCYVDGELAVHSDFKSHTGAKLTIVKVEIIYMSGKKTEHKRQQGSGVSRRR